MVQAKLKSWISQQWFTTRDLMKPQARIWRPTGTQVTPQKDEDQRVASVKPTDRIFFMVITNTL